MADTTKSRSRGFASKSAITETLQKYKNAVTGAMFAHGYGAREVTSIRVSYRGSMVS
jgi:hypothetical protein